jgi:hypothetical protein
MYYTTMTDATNLAAALNGLEEDGCAISWVIPHVENTTTLYMIVYREAVEIIP